MKKLDYLKLAISLRLYQKKIWLNSVASILTDAPANKGILDTLPGAIHRNDDEIFFFHPETNERVVIEDGDLSQPLFYKHEKLTIDGDFYHDVKPGTITTFGILLVNICLFWEPFKALVPYHNKLIEDRDIEKVISDLMVDNPKENETVPEGKASVDDCLKLSKQLNYLEGCNEIFVKAGSLQALDVADHVTALRDRLFEENKDKLDDPVVVADIIRQVVDADAEDQMNGDSADFYISKKYIDNARKKMFLVFGLERDFTTGELRLIKTPLNESWDKNMLTHYVNTAISASYDRGKSTGEGGADVNDLIRLFSRKRVSELDCETKLTETIVLTKDVFNGWVGSNYVEGGKVKRINADDTQLINTVVQMRVAHLCGTKDGDYCRTCCGEKLGSSETAIAGEVPLIATDFMLIKMKNAHVSKVDTTLLNLEDILM